MWDKIEKIARPIRYTFFVIAVGVFIATNYSAFLDEKYGMYLFIISGIAWMFSIAYVDIRENARFMKEVRRKASDTSTYHKKGVNKMVKWLRKQSVGVGVLFVLGAAIVLYKFPSLPLKLGIPLIVIGPLAVWFAWLVERRGQNNETLIRQLQPLIDEVSDFEYSIRNLVRDLLNNQGVKTELGEYGVQGWTHYIERLGDQQITSLSSIKTELKEIDTYKESYVRENVLDLYRILGRILEAESNISRDLYHKVSSVPAEIQTGWEYIQKTHQRLSAQLSSLKSLLEKTNQADIFNTFINQPPL